VSEVINGAARGATNGAACSAPGTVGDGAACAPRPDAGGGPIVVLKFGGTSLASPLRVRRAAARVRAQRRRGRRVVVVVSAAGHETDRLLTRIGAVAGRDPAAGREADRILATAEDRSAGLLALALLGIGVSARSLRGGEAGIGAAGPFGAGGVRRVIASELDRLLDQGIVPVVSGFQGEREDGETVTLGRGGSDISAVVIAAALDAAVCHIVTDVDAIYDSDPRRNPDARPFTTLQHAELTALTESGAEVVHPRAARLAAEYRVPLRIYSYRAPWYGGGTRVGYPNADNPRTTGGLEIAPDGSGAPHSPGHAGSEMARGRVLELAGPTPRECGVIESLEVR
jgi:aspartate kinase